MTQSDDTNHQHEEDDFPAAASIEDHPLHLASEIASRLSYHEQASFFCTLVDAALDGIIAHGPDGHVVWANQGASELLGYGPDEIMALPAYGWVAPAFIPGAPARIETIMREGHLTFESAVRCKDGSTIQTEVSTRRVDTALGPVVIAVVRDIHQWAEAEHALVRLAYHDPVTDLSNRVHFNERLVAAMADARRFGDVLGVAYLDLDRFRLLNDELGRDVGDGVLALVGRRLKDEVRTSDLVARIGRDEFAIILCRLATTEALARVASRLAACVREPMQVLGKNVTVEASVGLASFDSSKDDPRSLCVKANIAMCAAKLDPDNTWLSYFEGMPGPEGRLDW